MSFHGRSPDDLPLAAYSTGVAPDEDDALDPNADPDLPPPPALTQHDLAAALAGQPPAPVQPVAPAPRRGFRMPSMKLPSLNLGLGRGRAAALEQAAPFKPVPGAVVAPAAAAPADPPPVYHAVAGPGQQAAFQAVSQPAPAPSRSVAQPMAKPAKQPKMRKVTVAPPGAPAGLRGRSPQALLRDRRILAGGVVVIGLALLGFSMLNGGGPGSGSGGPTKSQDTTAVLPTPAVLGNASVEVTAGGTGTFALTSATGSGPAVNSRIDATWTAPTGESLGLAGMASQGTRATDPNFVLTWTMLIDGTSVTFTSRAAECTIGMAVGAKTVHGSITCKALKSADGKHRIDFRGAYTT
jgi:hypothetical protein